MPEKKIQLIKPWIEEEEHEAIKRVLESGYLTDGPETRAFEKEFAEFIGVDYAVATTSAATAMDLAVRILGVGPGDEVIVPDYTHPATADVVKMVGAIPVLVPVDKKTYNVTAEDIEPAITDKTKLIIPVSLFGQPLDIDPIMELAKKHNLYVMEDAACSAGAAYNNKNTGTQADITCFSFHPRKSITTGEGGMFVTNNKEWAELAKSMKHFGASGFIEGTRIVKFANIGTNYKLSNIQSCIGRTQLARMDRIIQERQTKARLYDELLKGLDYIEAPYVPEKAKHIYQCYCTLLKPGIDRDEVIRMMAEENIETQIGSYCLHMQPIFENERRVGDLKISREVYDRVLVLPLHHYLTDRQQRFVVDILTKVVKQLSQ